MAKKDNSTLCPDGCGHLWSEHWCSYKNINTPREVYKCGHCSCGVRGDDVPVPAGLKRVNGVWDYA
jgi:hypothetical protein